METWGWPFVIVLSLVALSLSSQGWLRVGTRHVLGPLLSGWYRRLALLIALGIEVLVPGECWRVAQQYGFQLGPPL